MTLAERIYRRTNRFYDRLRSPSAVEAARVEPTGSLGDLRGHGYCVLISFRDEGSPVASPLWFGLQNGRLYFRTGVHTVKLKRIRRNPEVWVAPCSARGRPVSPPFIGRARILDRSEEPKAEGAIRANQGWFRRIYLRLLTGRIEARYIEVVPIDGRSSAPGRKAVRERS